MATPSILIVEDEDSLVDVLEKALTNANFTVIRASNGKEALRLYDPQKVDIVLTDLIMPEKEGMELISELRRSNANVKIIAMSGGGLGGPNTYLAAAERLGAKRTLAKPFSCDELLAAIVSLLKD